MSNTEMDSRQEFKEKMKKFWLEQDNRTFLRNNGSWVGIVDLLCIFLLAMCPILQHYKGLLVDARATVLALFAPYILIRFWFRNQVRLLPILPLLLFCVYKVFDSGTSVTEIGREGLLFLYMLYIASGMFSAKKFIRCVGFIAAVASVLMIVQYFCYYILGFHLKLAPVSLFLKSSEQWIGMAETGMISIKGNPLSFYRPSSFFLEPAHMALYCTPTVLLLLLSPGMNVWRFCLAALVTIGVMGSTSGLGIMLCMGLWAMYFVFYFDGGRGDEPINIGSFQIRPLVLKERSFKGFTKLGLPEITFKGYTLKATSILLLGIMFLGVLLAYLCVPFFRSAINRIFASGDGYNAISGRTNAGAHAVAELVGTEWLFGKKNPGSEAEWYMSAFHSTIYDYGMIGFVLSYAFYVYCAFKLKGQYRWMALMILGLSYFTIHTHGSSYMLFFCTYLVAGLMEDRKSRSGGLVFKIHPFRLMKRRKKVNE